MTIKQDTCGSGQHDSAETTAILLSETETVALMRESSPGRPLPLTFGPGWVGLRPEQALWAIDRLAALRAADAGMPALQASVGQDWHQPGILALLKRGYGVRRLGDHLIVADPVHRSEGGRLVRCGHVDRQLSTGNAVAKFLYERS